MKRLIIVITFLLLSTTLVALQTVEPAGEQKVYGFVDATNYLELTLNEAILPFDILSPYAQPSSDPSIVNGIQLGTWTMISNVDTFNVAISYTPLTNGSSKINYTLYFFLSNNNRFIRTRAGSTTNININNPSNLFQPNVVHRIQNQSVFISLDETVASLTSSNFNEGIYNSTITITMTVGN